MTDQADTERIVVVGLNRPRLTKIMAMVEEQDKLLEASGLDEALKVEFVPCLAAMGSYKAEDGCNVRYMESFVYHDGSPMTQFFDDPSFRSSLKTVLMVGYEWKENDSEQVKNYFQANNLSLSPECVHPNSGFESLQTEMEFFKNLNEKDKDKHLSEQTMGPGKMAKFVLDAAQQVKKERLEKLKAEAAESAPSAESKEEEVAVEEKKQAGQPIVDPNLPRYACRMCRTVLFGQDHLAADHVQNLHSFKKANYNAKRPTVNCQSIFCSEAVLAWLSPNGQDIEGKLACPKCSFKIGHWRWSGAQCSCGTWLTPAIQIPTSKVDTMLPVSIMPPVSTFNGVNDSTMPPVSTVNGVDEVLNPI